MCLLRSYSASTAGYKSLDGYHCLPKSMAVIWAIQVWISLLSRSSFSLLLHIRVSSFSFPSRLPIDNFDPRLEVTGPKLICATKSMEILSLSLSLSLSLCLSSSSSVSLSPSKKCKYVLELRIDRTRLRPRKTRVPARRTYSPTYDYSTFMSRVHVVITPCPLISISTISRVKAFPLRRDVVIASGDRRLDESSKIAATVLERGRACARCESSSIYARRITNVSVVAWSMHRRWQWSIGHYYAAYTPGFRVVMTRGRYLFQCRRWKSPNDDDRGISLVSDRQRIR